MEGRVDTDVVRECFAQLSQHMKQRSSVFLDNASIQKSRACIQHIPQWVKGGLILKYLPPYSPALNLLEILWRFMQYDWRPFFAYVSLQCLLQSIEDILPRFGTDYTIHFAMK